MHIMVITDRFTPEVTAVSVRTLDHARVWLKNGHQVTVVTCAPNFPKGKLFDGYRNQVFQEENIEGIRVIRLWSYLAPNEGTFRRTFDYLSFTFSAIAQCRRLPDADVILATSPPIFTAVAGHVIAKFKRRPWVFELRDLWPASIKAVGISKSPLLRLIEAIELGLYRRSKRVLALTNAFKDDLTARHVPASKISVVPNGVDLKTFSRDRVTANVRDQLGVGPDEFLAGYIGTVGIAHGLDCIVSAAEICRDHPNLRFLIMGEGAEKARLQATAAQKGLTNLIFRDFVPHDQIINYIAALDTSIVHLKAHPVFKTVIPSKIFEHMALGLPIVLGVEGESADIITDAGCGVLVQPENPEALADAVRDLAANPAKLSGLGAAGKVAVEQRFSREALADAALQCLQQAAAD